MALIRCDFMAHSIGMNTGFLAMLPEHGDLKKAPVIYLLHGLSDNCTSWQRFTGIEQYAASMGAVVIMPEVQRSFYMDLSAGPQYFSYISQELPTFCEHIFGVSNKACDRYVMGLSMGGYGALKCALRFPQRYAGCAAFSAVTDINAYFENAQIGKSVFAQEQTAILGPDKCADSTDDLFWLVRQSQNKKTTLPPLFLTCGEQDRLYEMNLGFCHELGRLGIDHNFRSWKGHHSWDFWDKSVQMALETLVTRRKQLNRC